MKRDWDAVYDVLIEECGASPHQSIRNMFLNAATNIEPFYTNNRGFQEYRFQGALGFGGKIWQDHELNLSVDCYSEDRTPERALMIMRANARLLVVWANYPENAIGINRARGVDTHLGELIDGLQSIAAQHHYEALCAELSTWYRHAAGFFAGRGTAKAPREDPISIDLDELAQQIDAAWWRE